MREVGSSDLWTPGEDYRHLGLLHFGSVWPQEPTISFGGISKVWQMFALLTFECTMFTLMVLFSHTCRLHFHTLCYHTHKIESLSLCSHMKVSPLQ